LSDRPTIEQLDEVRDHFGLPTSSLVEKDWYVVKALAAIAAVDTGDLRLVFGGGTALGRAHGLIRRMSEDIDLKIVAEKAPSRPALRDLRRRIAAALLKTGFEFDPANEEHVKVMHESSFTRYQLPYHALAEGKGVLRPQIQIETSVWPMHRPAVDLPVRSFVAEAYEQEPEVSGIACTNVVESAAEKLVALTRRAGAELGGLRKHRDSALVRHIYDLHEITSHHDAADVAALAREVMIDDAATRGRDFPAHQKDPLAETIKTIDGIATDEHFSNSYAAFTRDMVYGAAPDFATAMATLKGLAGHLAKPPA
jgi:predicted nucleotidyltransferase component of viral defense system